VNATTNSILVSPKKIHAHVKLFEEFLLDSGLCPSLDASALRTFGRHRTAREAEIITFLQVLRGLEQIEKEKKKLENKKEKIKRNLLKPKMKRKNNLSSEDFDVSLGSKTDQMDICYIVGSENEEE